MNNVPDPNLAGKPANITPSDIYYTLFRHKWKIIICTMLGFVAAAGIYVYYPKSFSSQARLFIRYVEQGKTPTSAEEDSRVQTVETRGDAIINSELQIITSMDLALQIAEKLGPEQILEDTARKHEIADAANVIHNALTVSVPRKSSVISIEFSHPNRDITQPVLAELIDSYLAKHLETRSAGQFTSFVNLQAEQYRARVAKTEAELKDALDRAGVFSLEDAKADQNGKISRLRGALMDSKAELAARRAAKKQLGEFTNTAIQGAEDSENASVSFEQIDQGTLQSYASIQARLDLLLRNERDLLMKYTLGNSLVQGVQTQIEEVKARKAELEAKHPMLTATTPANVGSLNSTQNLNIDFRSEAIQVASLESKITVLEAQLSVVLAEAAKLSSIEIEIQELRRRKTIEEENYRYFSQSREQAKIDQAFGAGAVNNIGIVQRPSPPQSNATDSIKFAGLAAAGGLALGIAWAFLIELYLDRTIKRPIDVKRSLHIPLFLSIPDANSKRYQKLLKKTGRNDAVRRAKRAKSNKGNDEFKPKSPALQAAAKSEPENYGGAANTNAEVSPMDEDHSLHPYYEALRDRMIGFFEGRGLTHKPKLIGLTGLGVEPGTTTVASGLASTLSKTGEGNVLLVDMTLGQESAQQFYQGKGVTDLDHVLETLPKEKKNEGKLVVAAEGSNGYKLPKILPNRFNDIVPKLKASDFDYIIFDMPAVSPISVTPRLSSFMDAVLLVIESEKATRDVVERATELLGKTNQNVGAILNKTRSYAPSSLQEEYLGDL